MIYDSFGSLSLTESSPAQTLTEALTLAEVKQYLSIPERSPADSAEDAMVSGFIAGAREQAEICQGRDLVRKQWDLALDYWCSYVSPFVSGYAINLRAPLVSVELVQYKDSDGVVHALTEGVDYIVDTAKSRILPAYNTTWPTFTAWPSSAVLIRFTSGYSATSVFWSDSGQRIKAGMLLLNSEWFNNRLPLSYDIASGAQASTTLDRIKALLSAGALEVPR